MKKILLTTLLTILVVPVTSFAASFDCTKAASLTEKLICGDEAVFKLDDQLAASYKTALENATDKDAFKKTQIEWLKQQRACKDSTCLTQSYETRLDALKNNVAIKSKLETVKTPQYKLLPFKENKSLAETNGVCEAFLEILNTTPYEQLYNDIFLNVLKDKKDFEPLKWRKVENGESQFGKILEDKVAFEEEVKNKTKRVEDFIWYKNMHEGFDYFLSEARVYQDFSNEEIVPLLLFLDRKNENSSFGIRTPWNSIFLSKDYKSFYKTKENENGASPKWGVLASKQIFQYKDKYYSLDTNGKNYISIVDLHGARSVHGICKYELIK